MTTSQFISVRETAQILGISEKKVMDLVDQGKLQAYRIADQFLRLKKAQVLDLRDTGKIKNESVEYHYTMTERVSDFFYFNDFYLVSGLMIAFLFYLIIFI